mgnify:CR=1 FL=1
MILQELEDSHIYVFGIHSLVREFLFLGKSLILLIQAKGLVFLKKIYKILVADQKIIKGEQLPKKNSINDISNYRLAYFPHQSLKYGEFFKKTYFYEDNPNSIFFKENLLTLFFEKDEVVDDVSKRYFRRYNIPYATNISGLVDINKKIQAIGQVFIKLIQSIQFKGEKSLLRLCQALLLIKFHYKLINSLQVLNYFSAVKVIYFQYDVLVPSNFIFACYLKGIKTISNQERTYQYFYFTNLCYDYYLIAGEGFQKRLENHGYVMEEFLRVGLPRTSLFNSPQTKCAKEKYKRRMPGRIIGKTVDKNKKMLRAN